MVRFEGDCSDGGRLVADYVSTRIAVLQKAYLRGNSWATKDLAQLRRSVGRAPGATPEAWSLEFDNLPQPLVGRGPVPSRGEWSVHVALTLYAVHQQSQSKPMCVSGVEHGFGCAVRQLVFARHTKDGLDAAEMPHRFAAMVTAQSMGELAHYARQIVEQLRAEGISVDYPRLARELYLFQSDETRNRACLAWARGYTHIPATPVKANQNKGDTLSQ